MSLEDSKDEMPNEANEIGGENGHAQGAGTMPITLFLKL